MYKKLFKLSGFSNTQIVKKLNIGHTQRIQFERSKTIDIDKFILFAKQLELDEIELSNMVVEEIIKRYKKL
jgi:hypothetical protein